MRWLGKHAREMGRDIGLVMRIPTFNIVVLQARHMASVTGGVRESPIRLQSALGMITRASVLVTCKDACSAARAHVDKGKPRKLHPDLVSAPPD